MIRITSKLEIKQTLAINILDIERKISKCQNLENGKSDNIYRNMEMKVPQSLAFRNIEINWKEGWQAESLTAPFRKRSNPS